MLIFIQCWHCLVLFLRIFSLVYQLYSSSIQNMHLAIKLFHLEVKVEELTKENVVFVTSIAYKISTSIP